MSISLPPDLDAYVQAQVAHGHFASAEEVVAEAVRQMRDDHERLRLLVAEGNADLQAGHYTEYDAEGLRNLRAEYKAKIAQIRAEQGTPTQ